MDREEAIHFYGNLWLQFYDVFNGDELKAKKTNLLNLLFQDNDEVLMTDIPSNYPSSI